MSEIPPEDDVELDGAHADVAGWIMGSLDPVEAQAFARHLDGCPSCRETVRTFAPTRGVLAAATPPVELPNGMMARTLRAVDQAAARDLGRRRRTVRLIAIAASVLLVAGVAVAGLVRAGLLGPAPAGATVALAAPGGGTASGTASGRDTQAGWSVRMSVAGLPQIPDGHGHYECWYVAADDAPGHPDAVSAGSFEVDAAGRATNLTMWTVVDLKRERDLRMVVTREPDDDPAMTGPVVLSGPVRAVRA